MLDLGLIVKRNTQNALSPKGAFLVFPEPLVSLVMKNELSDVKSLLLNTKRKTLSAFGLRQTNGSLSALGIEQPLKDVNFVQKENTFELTNKLKTKSDDVDLKLQLNIVGRNADRKSNENATSKKKPLLAQNDITQNLKLKILKNFGLRILRCITTVVRVFSLLAERSQQMTFEGFGISKKVAASTASNRLIQKRFTSITTSLSRVAAQTLGATCDFCTNSVIWKNLGEIRSSTRWNAGCFAGNPFLQGDLP